MMAARWDSAKVVAHALLRPILLREEVRDGHHEYGDRFGRSSILGKSVSSRMSPRFSDVFPNNRRGAFVV
jgi:hypothetical protein